MNYLHKITVPTPFAIGPVNLYLAEGDELTLIDTGPNDPPTLESLRAQLAERGIAFKDIQRLIITHAHVDHFGLAAQIVAESGAKVYSHPRNFWWLTDFHNEWPLRYDFYHALFTRGGAPPAYANGVAQGMREMMRYGSAFPAENFVAINDGDTITLNGDAWRVLYMPGHQSGLVVLYEPKSRTLLSNDHLLLNVSSNPVIEPPLRGETERPRMLLDYLVSFEKTARLDVSIALSGHGVAIRDTRALIAARVAFHRARLTRIEQEIAAGAATPYELSNRLFPNLKAVDIFLAMSEVVGHLDVLETERRIHREQDNGLVRYMPIPIARAA